MKKITAVPVVASILFISIFFIAQARFANHQPSLGGTVVEQLMMNIPFGGRATALTVQPGSAIDAIVASESGGLFRTSDNGAHWNRIDTLPMFMMSDVQYLPAPNQNIVIASGKADGKLPYDTGGIWRSTDYGATWSKPNNYRPTCATRVNGGSIAIGGGIIYVANDCGLSVSFNQGADWSQVTLSDTPFSIAATSTGDVFVCDRQGIKHGHGTTIGGYVASGYPKDCRKGESRDLAVSLLNDNVLYMVDIHWPYCEGTQWSGTLYEGVYDSGTNMLTWEQASDTKCRPRGAGRSPYVAMTLSRDNNSTHYDLYFSDGYFTYRKTCSNSGSPRCGGTSNWQWMPTPHVDHNDIDFDPFTHCPKYLATDGGPTRPTSDEQNWCGGEWVMAGLPSNGYNALQIYDMTATNMSDHIDMYVGTQDNGFWGSQDGGVTWPNTCGNEGYFLTSPLTGTNHIAQDVWTTYTDPGAEGNFQLSAHLSCPANPWAEPLGSNTYRHGAPLLVGDKVYAQFAIITDHYPYNLQLWFLDWPSPWTFVSSTWANLKPLGQVSYAGDRVSLYQPFLRTVEATRNRDDNLGLLRFTGMNRNGSLSLDATVTFADSYGPYEMGSLSYYPPGEGAWVIPTVFGVDSSNPNSLMAADLASNSMKYSTDGGLTWAVDSSLTNLVTGNNAYAFAIPANQQRGGYKIVGAASEPHAIAYNPFVRNHIVVGTNNRGVIQSWDGGIHWAVISGTSKITNITDFAFKKPASGDNTVTFYVSTYGRGLWKITEDAEFHLYLMTTAFLEDYWGDLVVDPILGDPVDTRLLTDPSYCPNCQYFILPRNQIMDLILKSGQVSGVPLDGGRLIGSSIIGQPVRPDMEMIVTPTYGDFDGCPICPDIIDAGGTIRGVLTENRVLLAVVISWGDLPGAEDIVRFDGFPPQENIGSDFWGVFTPYLVLEGSYPFDGAAVVGSDDYLQVHGSGFSPDDVNCSPVYLYLEDKYLGGAWPTSEGLFDMAIQVTEASGTYWLKATQTCATISQPGVDAPQDMTLEDGRWVKVITEEGWWDAESLYIPIILR